MLDAQVGPLENSGGPPFFLTHPITHETVIIVQAKFTTNKQPSVPPMGEIEKTLRACRLFIRESNISDPKLVWRVNDAIATMQFVRQPSVE